MASRRVIATRVVGVLLEDGAVAEGFTTRLGGRYGAATSTVREHATEVAVPADPSNGLDADSAAQCQHLRAVASQRIAHALGNVGPVTLPLVRDTIATLLDL